MSKKFSFGLGPSPGCDCVMLSWTKDIVLLLPDQTASQKPLFSWCLPSLRHLWCWCFRWADNPQSQQKLANRYLKKKSQNRWLLYVWQYSTLLKNFNSLLFFFFLIIWTLGWLHSKAFFQFIKMEIMYAFLSPTKDKLGLQLQHTKNLTPKHFLQPHIRPERIHAIQSTTGTSDVTHSHSSTGEKLNPNSVQLVQVKSLICIYIAIQGLQL